MSYELLIFGSRDYSNRKNLMLYKIRTLWSTCIKFFTEYPNIIVVVLDLLMIVRFYYQKIWVQLTLGAHYGSLRL